MALPRTTPFSTPYGNPYTPAGNVTNRPPDLSKFGSFTHDTLGNYGFQSPFGAPGMLAALDLLKQNAGGGGLGSGGGGGSTPNWWQQHAADFAAEMAKLKAQQDFTGSQSEAAYNRNWNLDQGRGTIQSGLSSQNYGQNWNQRQAEMENERNLSSLHGAQANEQAIIGQGWQDDANVGKARSEFDEPLKQYGEERSRWLDYAKNGVYSPQEVEQMLASGQQEVQDQHNHAAENVYNTSLGRSINPAMAAAIAANGATEAGKARAGIFSDITKTQAQSRMDAGKQLGELLQQRAAIAHELAQIDMKAMPQYAKDLLARSKQIEDTISNIEPTYGAPGVDGYKPTYTAPNSPAPPIKPGMLPPIGKKPPRPILRGIHG